VETKHGYIIVNLNINTRPFNRSTLSLHNKKPKSQAFVSKLALTPLWDSEWPVLVDFQEQGVTQYCVMLCNKLKPVTVRKCRGGILEGVFIFHDDSQSHMNSIAVDMPIQLKFEVFFLYSFLLMKCLYFLFMLTVTQEGLCSMELLHRIQTVYQALLYYLTESSKILYSFFA